MKEKSLNFISNKNILRFMQSNFIIYFVSLIVCFSQYDGKDEGVAAILAMLICPFLLLPQAVGYFVSNLNIKKDKNSLLYIILISCILSILSNIISIIRFDNYNIFSYLTLIISIVLIIMIGIKIRKNRLNN